MGCSDSQPVYDPYAIHPSQRPQPYSSQVRQQYPQQPPQYPQQQQRPVQQPQQNPQQQRPTQQPPQQAPETYSVPISKPVDETPVQQPKAPAVFNTKDPDVQLIEKFLEIQTQIDGYDKGGVFDGLCIFEDENEELRKKKQQAEINSRVLAEKTKKEKQDYDNITQATVQGFFKDSTAREKAISKEEAEYIQALNEEEMAKNELKAVTAQFNESKKKLDDFKKQNEKAINLNLELSNILSSIFDGAYGSETENKLETELKVLSEERGRVQTALQKWSNARFLLVYAYNQIQCSEARWTDLTKLDIKDNSKVILATEVRNNLVAANQNLQSTKANLKGIDLPYCSEDDFKTLQGLATGIYTDMQNVERQRYVLNIVQTMRKRCAALCQWIDQVIKDSIVVEYLKTKTDYETKSKALKIERTRMMQDKIKEKTGKDVNIKIHETTREPTALDLNPIPNSPLDLSGENLDKTKAADIKEKPVSIGDLPPPPSKDQIMGNIQFIKQKYQQTTNEFEKNREESKREAEEKLQKILAQYEPKVE